MIDDDLKNWLTTQARSEASVPLLIACLGKALSKDDRISPIVERPLIGRPRRGFRKPDGDAVEQAVGHVADWIEAAVVNGDEWLLRVDDRGIPLSLKNIGTIEQAAAKADKAMLRAVQAAPVVVLGEGEEVCHDVGEGWNVVRMRTPGALDFESTHMQHCIGNGAYDKDLDTGKARFYSLRDPSGKPHVTIEIRDDRISQMKGKQNAPPARRYIDKLPEFLRSLNLYVDNDRSLSIGLVRTRDGSVHNLYDLPDVMDVPGNLNLEGFKIPRLPHDMRVGGYLDVCNTGLTRLPRRLEVGMHLNLGHTNIIELPEHLKIGGDLDLTRCSMETLPDGLEIGGSLILKNSNVHVLPAGLKVGKLLHLPHDRPMAVPEDAVVGGLTVASGRAVVKPAASSDPKVENYRGRLPKVLSALLGFRRAG